MAIRALLAGKELTMRIVLFTETYLPHLNGVVTHVDLLRRAFTSMGHDVLVVTASDVTEPVLENGVLRCPGSNLKKIYNYQLASPVSPLRKKFVEEFSPDIIHIHNEFGIGFSGLQIAKSLKLPVVYTLHSDYDQFLYYISHSNPALDQAVAKAVNQYLKFFIKRVTLLVSPSPKAESYARRVGSKKPVHVLANAVDVADYREPRVDPSFRQSYRLANKIGEKTAAFIFVGRIGQEKQINELIYNFCQLNLSPDEARLFIYGKGPGEKELQDLIKLLKLNDRVEWKGSVPNTEIPNILSAMDYYITASQSEMHSISMLEAQAVGLPALALSDPLNDWQIEEGVNGFIWHDKEELNNIVKKLLAQSPADKAALHQACRNWSDQHDYMDQAHKLLNLYREAIELYRDKQDRKKFKKLLKRQTGEKTQNEE